MIKVQQPTNSFLSEINGYIKNCHFQDAHSNCLMAGQDIRNRAKLENGAEFIIDEKNWKKMGFSLEFLEIQSMRSYCLVTMNKVSEAIQILEKCINFRPNHSLSHRRLGYAYQKEGNIENALKQYHIAQLYQPQNPYLSNLIMKLQNKVNNQHVSHEEKLPKTQQSYSSIMDFKQHVTFGTSQIFEMVSQHSDQYFAHIKKQLNKLNDIKPKKSILKGSKSLNKDSTSIASYTHSQSEQKIEMDELNIKKSLSMKSCNTESPLKWEEDQNTTKIDNQKLLGSAKKEKKKKKGVKFSLGFDQEEQKL